MLVTENLTDIQWQIAHAIAFDIEMPYETVKTYAKRARCTFKSDESV